MNDRIVNQLNMARRALACLNKTEHALIWTGVPPLVFSTKVATAGARLTEAEALAQAQTRATTGSAQDKAREEAELETICHTLGSALVACCLDRDDAAGAAPFDISLTAWRALRDETLLQRAEDLAAAIAALLVADAPGAATYGLVPASHTSLLDETADYRAFIVAPDTAIGERSTNTRALATKVRELLAAFAPIDRLILQYKTTAAGEAFVSAYFNARTIIDRGHGPAPEDPPAPPPAPPAPPVP